MKKNKIIAFYLPQFHTIPENDEWRGKGFTEWTNVKKSKPQFKWHHQPEIPLNGYYDLSDPSQLEHQAKLATKYGIDGFCYYHYWFNGKLLLNKPLDDMLQNRNVKIDYCFCWANESWARTWDGKEKHVLIEQNYDESYDEIKKHFLYLLPFFYDERYLKVNNKPIFIIYKPHLMEKLNYFMKVFDQLAKENGFNGIFWGFQHHDTFSSNINFSKFDLAIEFQPFYILNNSNLIKEQTLLTKISKKILKKPTVFSYDNTRNYILESKPKLNISCPGAFVSWDNTPRRGNKSIIFKGADPIKFKKYFTELLKDVNEKYNSDFIFINAWNEWAEGAHLEPDTLNGYGYLEAVMDALDIKFKE